MNKAISKKALRLYLIIGVVLMLVGQISLIFFEDLMDTEGGMYNMMNLLHQYGWLVLVLGASIFPAIFEEMAYRLWVKGKTVFKVISLVVMACFLLWQLFGINRWYYALAVWSVMAILYFMPVKERMRAHILIVSTSLLFALAHWHNFNISLFSIPYFIAILGGGFTFAALGLRFGFKYSMLGHFINNFLRFGIILYFIVGFNSIEGKGKDYSYELSTPDCLPQTEVRSPSATIYANNPADLLIKLSTAYSDTVFLGEVRGFGIYSLNIYGNKGAYYKEEIKQDILKKIDIEQKVEQQEGYTISLNPDRKYVGRAFVDKSEVSLLIMTGGKAAYQDTYVLEQAPKFVKYLWEKYQLPITLDKEVNSNASIEILAEFYAIKDKDEALEYLMNHPENGLLFEKKPITVVTYQM